MGIINDVDKRKESEEWTHIEDDSRSLKNCLRKFGFQGLLQDLDDNLEEVRRNKFKEDVHKNMIKDINKKLLTLSLKHHPDHFIGAFQKKVAHDNQVTINAMRTLITRLSEDFLRDIEIDYRYEYYADVDINSIGNEKDVEKLNLNLQYQLIMLSEIKHEKIIANIKKFLMSCEGSLDSYYNNDSRNFVLNFNLALNRLKECILGYKELTREFRNVEKECVKDYNLQNTLRIVQKIAADFEIQLKILEKIKHAGKQSLKGNFQFYADNEFMDTYFVLPFAKYINVLSMCNVMIGNTEQSWLSKFNKRCIDFSQFDGNDEDEKFLTTYYLASYFDNPNSSSETDLHSIFNISFKGDRLMSFCKNNFDGTLHKIREKLKEDFNVEKHYIVKSVRKQTEEYNREVQNFLDEMSRRKQSNLLAVMDGQEKSRIGGKENAMFLSERMKYERNTSRIYPRIRDYTEKFKDIKKEEDLLKKIQDNFQERDEKLKTKILQSEITNEKMREALDVYKNEETILLEKLGKFHSKNYVKLINEILDREEENRKLKDEIEKKREEERHLILTLCGNYEKIRSLIQDKINELEINIPRGNPENENRRSEINVNESVSQEEKNNLEEDDVRGKLAKTDGNQTLMHEMERKRTGGENSAMGAKYRTCVQEIKNKIKSYSSKWESQDAFRIGVTEENSTKTIEKDGENHNTTKVRHHSELQKHLPTNQALDKDNTDVKFLQKNDRGLEFVPEIFKENESLETSGGVMCKKIPLPEHGREECIKCQPQTNEFKNQSTDLKNPIDKLATKNVAHDDSVILIQHRNKTKYADLLKESGYSNISREELKRRRYTLSFGENDKIKEITRFGLTKSKSTRNFDKMDEVYKNINKNLMLKQHADEEISEVNMEMETSYELFEKEQKKDEEMVEALRNLNQNCKLEYARRKKKY